MALTLLVAAMTAALLLPVAAVCRPGSIWQRLAALASLSTKASVLLLVVAVQRDDPMPGVVGVLVLSVGNAGLLLLTQLLRQGAP